MTTLSEIRAKYLAFMEERGHVHIPSAPMVPHNDPTTLFTGSGMQPLITYLLGEPHPKGARLVDSQKSFRAEDIEEVGDNRHTTFFEMLGNWSLGDYFKKEQLRWFFEFLTGPVGLDPQKLYVTVFQGDEKNNVPRDTESAEIWQKLFSEHGIEAAVVDIGSEARGNEVGMQGGRIFYYDAKKNWWSRAGVPDKMPAGEPGGPDSEVFYDFGPTTSSGQAHHDTKFGPECHPNCDCGRFVEIGNSVFMQYLKQPDGSFALLPKQNVDFGGGLERITAAANADPDVFNTDVFADIISLLEHFSGKKYTDPARTKSFRIVADHMRAATFMLGEGVKPSNTDQGYVLRRLLRRAAQHAQKLEVEKDQREESILSRCAVIIMEKYASVYPELSGEEAHRTITEEIWKEEKQFGHTLEHGLKEFEKVARNGTVTADDAFLLFTTYGFPFEMTHELAEERGITIDVVGYKEKMKAHQDLSRSGSEKKFKGGLADASVETTRLHTAHHLVLRALQLVLGDHVKQRGSNITGERLRIDFSHGAKLTPEQKTEVERIVNEQMAAKLPVHKLVLPKEIAETLGAEHEFGATYPDTVSVYMVGPEKLSGDAKTDASHAFSKEFCGGPHVTNTGEVAPGGTLKIIAEEAVAAGIRRIKAATRLVNN